MDVVLDDCWATYNFEVCVILLSLEPRSYYPLIDTAIANAYALYCAVTIMPAGNQASEDSCHYSPARAPWAMTVAASDSSDNWADFSNWGKCVDFVAPGVDIPMACQTSTTCTTTASGTSYAAALTAGLAAYFVSYNDVCMCDYVWYLLWIWGLYGKVSIQWYPLDTSYLVQNNLQIFMNANRGNMSSIRAFADEQRSNFVNHKQSSLASMDKMQLKKEIKYFMGKHPELLKKMRKEF